MVHPPEHLFRHRLLAVAVVEEPEHGLRLAETLLAAGLDVLEVTLRTPKALEVMAAIHSAFPRLHLGAGTVIDPGVIPTLAHGGVKFVVSPGLNEAVVRASLEAGLPVIPGVMTPTEIEGARALGLQVLKFFPAEAAGGVEMLQALAGPYGHTGLRFVPTGGIHAGQLASYLALPQVAAVGGSWFVDRKLVQAGNFDEIGRRTREALEIAGKA